MLSKNTKEIIWWLVKKINRGVKKSATSTHARESLLKFKG